MKSNYMVEMNFPGGIQKQISYMKFKSSDGDQPSKSERGIKRCRSVNNFIETEDFKSLKPDNNEHVSKLIQQDNNYRNEFASELGDIGNGFVDSDEDIFEFNERKLISDQNDSVDRSYDQSMNTSFRGRKRRNSYGLRPRCDIKRSTWDEDEEGSQSSPPKMITRSSSKQRGIGGKKCAVNNPKSKYRRNTANARERDRMKEINVAFATLRGALPSFACRRVTSMTKIKTLKLASSYIQGLSDVLADSQTEDSKRSSLQFFDEISEDNETGFDAESNYFNSNESLFVSDISKSSSNIIPNISDRTQHISNFSALRTALSAPLKNIQNSDGEKLSETNFYGKQSNDKRVLTEKSKMHINFKQKSLLDSEIVNLNSDNSIILRLNASGKYNLYQNLVSSCNDPIINEHFQKQYETD